MMRKKEKNAGDTGVPDSAVRVKEIGPWTVFFSRADMSVYFKPPLSLSTVLRLSKDDLLMLAEEIGTWRDIGKKAEAAAPPKEEIQSPESSRDKRRFRRFTKRCEVEFTSRGVTNRSIASDFSLNGLFIRTNHPFAADTVISIVVHLPDGSISSLKGKVKRSMKNAIGRVAGIPMKEQKNGMGIELIDKDAVYLHFIRSLIK